MNWCSCFTVSLFVGLMIPLFDGCFTSLLHASDLKDVLLRRLYMLPHWPEKLQIKLPVSPSHSTLTLGQPVNTVPIKPGTWQGSHQASNFKVTGISVLSAVWKFVQSSFCSQNHACLPLCKAPASTNLFESFALYMFCQFSRFSLKNFVLLIFLELWQTGSTVQWSLLSSS